MSRAGSHRGENKGRVRRIPAGHLAGSAACQRGGSDLPRELRVCAVTTDLGREGSERPGRSDLPAKV